MSYPKFTTRCIATTAQAFCEPSIPWSQLGRHRDITSNSFRSAQFSADGTSIITHNEDQCVRSFVLPPDLLEVRDEAQLLTPYSNYKAGSNIQAYTLYPGYNLQDPATTLMITASADVPLTLRNALFLDTAQAHYPLVHSRTEEHRPARSLAFTRDGTHFLAGSDNVLALFDCHRNGEGPVSELRLKPGKGSATRYDSWSLSRKGVVSAIGVSHDGVVAVGTYEREVGLYDSERLGKCASAFPLDGKSGTGVTDLKWSPDGTYLLVAERQSDAIQVYDVRYQQKMVSTLTGRCAKTTQKLGIDLISTVSGCEIWAGGTDGHVRMWSNPGLGEGVHAPDAVLSLHDAPIASALWHPTGVVLATCSGTRLPAEAREVAVKDGSSDETIGECSIATEIDASSVVVQSDDRSNAHSFQAGQRETSTLDNSLRIWTL